MTGAVDPGWGAAVRKVPLAMLPTRGMRMASGSTDSLTVMRLLWLTFTAVMVLLGVVVVVIDRVAPGGGVDGRAVGVVVVGLGAVAQLVAAKVVTDITGATMPEVRAAAQRAFFLRVALAEPAALLGFLGFVVSGNAAVYGAGFVVGMAGMIDAAPTRAWLERGQQQLRGAGSDVELLAALVSGGLTR
jgi:hypothetical protein